MCVRDLIERGSRKLTSNPRARRVRIRSHVFRQRPMKWPNSASWDIRHFGRGCCGLLLTNSPKFMALGRNWSGETANMLAKKCISYMEYYSLKSPLCHDRVIRYGQHIFSVQVSCKGVVRTSTRK